MKPKISTIAGISGALFAAGLLFASCTPSAVVDYCAEKCDCERCSDKELEECEIKQESRIDEANAYDCEQEYLDRLDCRLNKGECQDGTDGNDDYFGVECNIVNDEVRCDCEDEKEDYSDCVDDNSKDELIDFD